MELVFPILRVECENCGAVVLVGDGKRAEASSIHLIVGMALTLKRHREGLLNYSRYPISTGSLEGTNNKIKTLKRQAYG